MDKSLTSDCVYVWLGRSDDIESDRSQLITSPSSMGAELPTRHSDRTGKVEISDN